MVTITASAADTDSLVSPEPLPAAVQNDADEKSVSEREGIAVVCGELVQECPDDLYIPPEALRVFLETFEGPLDLLLYLIKRQNLDILDIPIARVTQQYMEYVDVMQQLQFELAADYLVMAAMLAEIKSRLLLPRMSIEDNGSEEDPRAELVRRLQEYERFKQVAMEIDELPRDGRDVFAVLTETSDIVGVRPLPDVYLRDLLLALKDVMQRSKLTAHYQVKRDHLSLRDQMTKILTLLRGREFLYFIDVCDIKSGRIGIVVSFMAILELLNQKIIEVIQKELFSPIHIKAV